MSIIYFQISSVLPLAKNFKNDSFLVVHGTGDGKSNLITERFVIGWVTQF